MMNICGGASITSKGFNLTQTYDKVYEAKGCYFINDKGHQITDWAMGLYGPLDGYSPEWWVEALRLNAYDVASSLPSKNEQLASDLLQEFYPDCDSVRWMSDGSNPNEAAVRLARAGTGRKVIAFSGYHGYGESFPHNPDANDLSVDERRGIPEEMWKLTRQFNWGDAGAVLKLGNDVAAIIVEVPPTDRGAEEFLQVCADRAKAIGAYFVLDDVVTGFRVAPGGAVERYGVRADMYCVGKAIGNGFNVSALVGKENPMSLLTRGVHYSATYNGAGLATGMALATMNWINSNREIYPVLYERGELLKRLLNGVFESFGLPCRMVGNVTRPILENADEAWLKEWRKRMYAKGYYTLAHPWYVTMAHTESVICATAETCWAVCKEMQGE